MRVRVLTARKLRGRRGSVIVLLALLLTALLAMAAAAVDLAYLMEVRSAMQNVADSTALAAVTGLTSTAADPVAEARDRAQYYASSNTILGDAVDLLSTDITFGFWDADSESFNAGAATPNAARVILRRVAGEGGDMQLFFAPILGRDRVDLSVEAIAAFGPRTMVLALDRSASMEYDTEDGGPPQPLTDVRNRASEFVDRLGSYNVEGDYLGLVTYDELARRDIELDELAVNQNTIRNTIRGMRVEYDPDPPEWGCTNIGHGLRLSHDMMLAADSDARSNGVRTVILLSDGVTNTRMPGSPSGNGRDSAMTYDPCFYAAYYTWRNSERDLFGNVAYGEARNEADLLRQEGILLYTISFGEEADTYLMQWMANRTGGMHYFAADSAALAEVFERISEQMPVVLVR